jgi:hypothetical protein
MDEIGSGSRQPDPLGADEMPGLLETAEMEDMLNHSNQKGRLLRSSFRLLKQS